MEIEEIYNRQVDMVYRICFSYFKGNKSDIEDAIQTIFMKIIDKKIIFESLEHEKAWIIVATNNYCKNKIKHWWNQTTEIDDSIKTESYYDNTLELILNLPEKYKLPIYMYYYEGYKCNEIAKILNTKENTIYSYLHTGRQLLKEILEVDKNE